MIRCRIISPCRRFVSDTVEVRVDVDVGVSKTIDSLPDPIVQPNFFNLTGEQPWSTRRIKVYDRIVSEKVQILGGHSLGIFLHQAREY